MTPTLELRTRRQIPGVLTGFVGRSDVIESVIAVLQEPGTRLVTLTGPAGIGKSRLAIEIGSRFERDYPGMVGFIPLAPLDSPDDVLPSIAHGLGLWDAEGSSLTDRIISILRDDPVLLILDNFEHLAPAATHIVPLLGSCPGLKILATSRVPLHVQGEREYSVPQMEQVNPASPATTSLLENESIQLFVQRAQAVNRDLSLDQTHLHIIAEICNRLEGLPLAIELAAARTKVLPLGALRDRLSNQLLILRSDTRDLPPRLRTMNAAIAWSYDLLSEDEQRLFRLLSVFRTTFRLDAASYLTELDDMDTLDGLESLIDKSMLSLRASNGNEPTYRMLQVMRQYGLDRLEEIGELFPARHRHASYFLSLAERAYADYFGAGDTTATAMLERHHDDLRAAISWSIENQDFETAARFGASLWVFWHLRCHLGEGRRWMARLISNRNLLPGEYVPLILFGAGVLATSQRDFDQVRCLADELTDIASQSSDPFVQGLADYLTGSAVGHQNPEARRYYQKATEAWRDLGAENWTWYALSQVALSAIESGDTRGALEQSRDAYNLCKRLNHSWAIALTGSYLGRVERHLDMHDAALNHLKEALTLAMNAGDRVLIPTILEHIAGLAASGDQPEKAARLFGHAGFIREARSFPTKPVDVEQHAEAHNIVRDQIGASRFTELWDSGRRMPVDEIVLEAMSIQTPENAESTRPTGKENPFNLTSREAEVLRGIVAGKTDREIAEDLFVSYRTVTTHVTHILNKLGTHSRTEAAAIAVRNGVNPA